MIFTRVDKSASIRYRTSDDFRKYILSEIQDLLDVTEEAMPFSTTEHIWKEQSIKKLNELLKTL